MAQAAHDRLWERLLAALASRDVLPAQEDAARFTPSEIARHADGKLGGHLATDFVEKFYLERRYGGASSRLSEDDAEELITRIESSRPTAPAQTGRAESPAPAQKPAPVEVRPARAPAPARTPPPASAAIGESLPVGTEYLPKVEPAPLSVAPASRVIQQTAAAVPAAARQKPADKAKAKKTRTLATRTPLISLGDLPRTIVILLIWGLFYYWSDHWRLETHWKLVTQGDSTYIAGKTDITGKNTNQDRETLSFGCENGQDFLRLTFDKSRLGNPPRTVTEYNDLGGLYFHETAWIQAPDASSKEITQGAQNHLLLLPAESGSTDNRFQLVARAPYDREVTQTQFEKQGNSSSVPGLLAQLANADHTEWKLNSFANSKHLVWTYPENREGPDLVFGGSGLAKRLRDLAAACHWDLPSAP